MIILGIESSCDETAAALLEDGKRILASLVSSQVQVHRDYGGVVPELASREHVDNIVVVVEACFEEAARQGFSLGWKDLDAVAATRGPGLMGALLVGMTYAKAVAYALQIPFLGVNHLQGHIGSIFLDHPQAEVPALSLVVSGGHTNLYHLNPSGGSQLLARTLDDAAGEALDKLSKLLGLGYPGGPVIDRLAKQGDPEAVRFTLPRIKAASKSGVDAFSFSGLKSAALRHVRQNKLPQLTYQQAEQPGQIPRQLLDLLASYQKAVIDQLISRLEQGLSSGREVRAIHLSGGVSCNSELRRRAAEHFEGRGIPVYFPPPALTTDNAAMIAAAASQRLADGQSDPWDLAADPNLRV